MPEANHWRYMILVAALLALSSCSRGGTSSTPVATIEPSVTVASGNGILVEAVEIQTLESFPVQVNVIVRGNLLDDCTTIEEISQNRAGSTFSVTVSTERLAEDRCTEGPMAFEETLPLDVVGLPAGVYTVEASGLQGTFTLRTDNTPDQGNAVVGGRLWHDLCVNSRDEGAPESIPPDGCVVSDDRSYLGNGLFELEEPGLGGVIVNLGAGACPASGLAATITDGEGVYLFSGLTAGTYCVSINVLNEQNAPLLDGGEWTFPVEDGQGSAAVTLMPSESKLDVNFGWDYLSLPEARNESLKCTNEASFVTDVTIVDDTILAPGELFTKIWQLENKGTCTWGSEYSIVLVDGDRMDAPRTVLLDRSVAPGETVALSVTMTAPPEAGNYRGDWRLRDPDGNLFGVGPGDGHSFWVQIVVSD